MKPLAYPLIRTVCLLCALSTSWNAAAQQKFSRACSFDSIPGPLRDPFLLLTNLIGSAPWGTFNLLNTASTVVRKNHYVLESLTVHYFQVLYALYAENQVYVLRCPGGIPTANSTCNWRIDYAFRSEGMNGWVAQALSPVILGDLRLSVFFNNRGFLYSARAGDPKLFQSLDEGNGTPLYANPVVVGNHSYRNNQGVEVNLGKSTANSCNLTEWGLGVR